MKPKIFLSHSKADKELIEKLANDLRSCSIDCWYDEWEIPPGESIKKKIFEEGIPNCDAFFIYLSDDSLSSYWVQKEIDAATFQEAESQQSIILPFVNQKEIRDDLPLDLKSISCPVLNEDNFEIPFGKIISKVWDVFYQKREEELKEEYDNKILKLENKVLKLEKRLQSSSENILSHEDIKEKLNSNHIYIFENSYSYTEFIDKCKSKLASGTTIRKLETYFKNLNTSSSDKFTATSNALSGTISGDIYDPLSITKHTFGTVAKPYERIKDLIGELIIWDLVSMETSDQADFIYLTEKGKAFIRNSL